MSICTAIHVVGRGVFFAHAGLLPMTENGKKDTQKKGNTRCFLLPHESDWPKYSVLLKSSRLKAANSEARLKASMLLTSSSVPPSMPPHFIPGTDIPSSFMRRNTAGSPLGSKRMKSVGSKSKPMDKRKSKEDRSQISFPAAGMGFREKCDLGAVFFARGSLFSAFLR